METCQKLREKIDHTLEKVQQKEWAEPLGKALNVTGKICGTMGDIVSGLGVLGGALTFGANLLNPEVPAEELEQSIQ